jgi:patatin-like phospholipase/acyl hydrolase
MKQMLTCDGGGVRGVFALQLVQRIEAWFSCISR